MATPALFESDTTRWSSCSYYAKHLSLLLWSHWVHIENTWNSFFYIRFE